MMFWRSTIVGTASWAVPRSTWKNGRVAGELVEDATGRREQRVQVAEALVGLRGRTLVGNVEALDDVLEVLDRLRRERVEDLVEIDLGGRVGERNLTAVRDLRRVGVRRRQGQLDLAARDRRQRGGADLGGGPRLQRRVVGVDRELDQRLAVRPERDVLD